MDLTKKLLLNDSDKEQERIKEAYNWKLKGPCLNCMYKTTCSEYVRRENGNKDSYCLLNDTHVDNDDTCAGFVDKVEMTRIMSNKNIKKKQL